MRPLFTVLLLFSFSSPAADKLAPVKGVNEAVEVLAELYTDREAVKALLGVDAGMDLYVVELKLRPRGDTTLPVSRDDFTLISRKDGQKTQAMHPSQVAGPSSLIVNSTAPGAGGGMLGQRRGPIWGGVPGTGDRPRRIGGDDDTAVASTTPGKTESTVRNQGKDDNPVLAALKEKELPQSKSNEPANGLLYFILEGKHKPKDLELIYRARGGTLILDFQK